MDFIPTTATAVEKLNRLAKNRRKAISTTLAAALNQVAQENGYAHWKHVKVCEGQTAGSDDVRQQQPDPGSSASPGFEVTVSAHWSDPSRFASGVEIASVTLSGPWSEFLTLAERRSLVANRKFRIAGKDRSRLVSDEALRSPISALFDAKKAARALAFVDVLRVKPANWRTASEALGVDLEGERFPAKDHLVAWFDPSTGIYFFTNEPYQDRLVARGAEQRSWLKARGLVAERMPDCSIHNPPSTELQVLVRAGQAHIMTGFQERRLKLAKAIATVR